MAEDRQVRIIAAVPEEVRAQAKSRAALERTTISAVVRGLLEEWLAGNVQTPPQAQDSDNGNGHRLDDVRPLRAGWVDG